MIVSQFWSKLSKQNYWVRNSIKKFWIHKNCDSKKTFVAQVVLKLNKYKICAEGAIVELSYSIRYHLFPLLLTPPKKFLYIHSNFIHFLNYPLTSSALQSSAIFFRQSIKWCHAPFNHYFLPHFIWGWHS